MFKKHGGMALHMMLRSSIEGKNMSNPLQIFSHNTLGHYANDPPTNRDRASHFSSILDRRNILGIGLH